MFYDDPQHEINDVFLLKFDDDCILMFQPTQQITWKSKIMNISPYDSLPTRVQDLLGLFTCILCILISYVRYCLRALNFLKCNVGKLKWIANFYLHTLHISKPMIMPFIYINTSIKIVILFKSIVRQK